MTGTINASRIRVMLIDAGTIPLAKCAHLVASHPFRGQIEDIPSGSVRVIQMKDVDPVEGVNWAGMSQTELTGRKGADWLEEGDVIFVPRGTRFYAACLSAPPSVHPLAWTAFFTSLNMRGITARLDSSHTLVFSPMAF